MRRRRGGRARPSWAVDTAIGDGAGTWALVDDAGELKHWGRIALVQRPQADSTQAEADGILAALEHVPRGTELATDCLMIVRALRSSHARHEVSGRIGEIADFATKHGVRIVWCRRTDWNLRQAHRFARERSRARGSDRTTGQGDKR